jgi:hypothetical protein
MSSADEARDLFPRFDDAWSAFHWLLARKAATLGLAPSSGDDNLRLYVQEGDALAGAPTVWAVFRVDADQVEIIDARFVKADEDDPTS